MRQLKSLVLVSTLPVVALFSTPAAAVSGFSGTLSGLQYTLTDLDLTDGISPSISFDVAGASLYTRGALEGATTDYGMQTTAPGQQINRADLNRFDCFLSAAFFSGQIVNPEPLFASTSGTSDVLTNGGLPDSGGAIHASSTAMSDTQTSAPPISWTTRRRPTVSRSRPAMTRYPASRVTFRHRSEAMPSIMARRRQSPNPKPGQ